MNSQENDAAAKRITVFEVRPPGGGLVYLTNSMREVLDEIKLARFEAEVVVIKHQLTRGEAEAAPNFIGRFEV